MRPAQLTPENGQHQVADHHDRRASMRPAQLTPENASACDPSEIARPSFNEAGAINAGKLCLTVSLLGGRLMLQ